MAFYLQADPSMSKEKSRGVFPNHHYTQIILEEMRSQIAGLAEIIESKYQTLDAKIDHLERKLSSEIEITQMALRTMKLDYDKRFDAIDKRFEAIDKKFEAIDRRFEAMDKRFEAMDKRFDILEDKLDQLNTKVEGHDHYRAVH